MPRRVLHDEFFKRAKADGYAARSAYKLIEIDDRNQILRKGDRVLDLGCAPGSWTQVAAQRVGPSGVVAGVDLQRTTAPLPPHARAIVADAFQTTPAQLAELLGGRADVLLSDMAPSTTGDPRGDHYRSAALCRRVLELAPRVLRPGARLAMKIFEGAEYPAVLEETRALFDKVKGLKPKATRGASVEMFIIATGFHAAIDEPHAEGAP